VVVVGLGLVLLGRGGSRLRRWGGRVARAGSIAIAAVTLAAAGATPALAVDATGTWSGRSACRHGAATTTTATERRASTMQITQRGDVLFIESDGTAYRGRSHTSGHGARRALGRAARRTGDGHLKLGSRVGGPGGRATVIAKAGVRDGSGLRRCRSRSGRTSAVDPGMAPSPPPRGAFCGDGVVDRALNEECDGDATGTPCD